MNGRELLEQALHAYGIFDPPRIESHLRGCNLDAPVVTEVLEAEAFLDVWVRNNGEPGKYGAPEGEHPAKLGIVVEGRHRRCYRVTKPFAVVRCTAANFPLSLIEGVGGEGDGIQYLLPPGWLEFVERVL